MITVIALGLLLPLLLPLGLGVLVGLGIFQFVLLANMARSMVKLGGGGIGGMLDAGERVNHAGRRRRQRLMGLFALTPLATLSSSEPTSLSATT